MELLVSKTVPDGEIIVGATHLADVDQVVALTQSRIYRCQGSTENAAWTSTELLDVARTITWNAQKDMAAWCNASQTACTIVATRTLEQFQIQLPDTTSRMDCVEVGRRASHVVFQSLHHLHVWRRHVSSTDGTWSTVDLPPPNHSARSWHAITQSRTVGALLVVGAVHTKPSDGGRVVLECTADLLDVSDSSCRVIASKRTTIPLPDGSVVLDLSFHAPSQRLAVHTSSVMVAWELHSQTHSTIQAGAATACSWHDRGLCMCYPDGRIAYLAEDFTPLVSITALAGTPPLHITCLPGRLVVGSSHGIVQVYRVTLPSKAFKTPPTQAANATTRAATSPVAPLFLQRAPVSLTPLITQFVHQSPTDTPPSQWFSAFMQLSKLVRVACREDLLLKVLALAMHGLHRSWPHSMRQLLSVLLRHIQPMSTWAVDTFAGLLKEASHSGATTALSAAAGPRFCATIQSLRDSSSDLTDALPPWTAPLVAFYSHTFQATPNELDAWIPLLCSYNTRKLFHHVDVALLRRDPQDVRLLRLVATVMTLHFVHLTPFVPTVGPSSLRMPPRLTALTMWGSSTHHPQWTLATAIQLATASHSVPFLLTLCTQFSTPYTDEFVTTLCRQHPTIHVRTVASCYLRQLCRVYAALPLLPYSPRFKRFNRAILSTSQDARSPSRRGLSNSRIYRLYTMQRDDDDSPWSGEAVAAHFAVLTLRHVKRLVLLSSASPSVFSSLWSGPPSTAQLELAYRVDAECAWRYIEPAEPSTPTHDAQSSLMAAFALVAWACIVRDLAGDARWPGKIDPRHGCWHVARLSSLAAAVFGKTDLDVRTVQIQHVAQCVRDRPLDAIDVLAFVTTLGTKALLAKRTSALMAQCDAAIPSRHSSTVEAAQVWMAARVGCRDGDLASRVAWDPWFWAFCADLADLETAPVQQCRTREAPLEVPHEGGRVSSDTTARFPRETQMPPSRELPTSEPLRLMQARRSQSESNMKQRSPSVANVLKLLQLQKAQHVTRPSTGETSGNETSDYPSTKSSRMEPLTERPAGVQPLAFDHDDTTAQRVALKLLRKCQSARATVSLRPRDFLSAPSIQSPPLDDEVVSIAHNTTQTIHLDEPTTDPATKTPPPPVTVASTATMTASVATVDIAAATDPPPLTVTQGSFTVTQVVPTPKLKGPTVKFPVYVTVPPPHTQRQGYVHVADVDVATTAQPPLRFRIPRQVSAPPDEAAAPALSGTVVDDSDDKTHTGGASVVSDPLRLAFDSVAIDDEAVDDAFKPAKPQHGPMAQASTTNTRVASLKQQMQTMADRLKRIESFADAIDSEFTESHERIAQIQERRRGIAGLLDRGFDKKLQTLDEATADMQHSLAAARDTLASDSAEEGRKTATTRPPSVLAKKAADGMAQAKQLLQQLETTLHQPRTGDNI